MPDHPIRPQVFLSDDRDPRGDAEFARGLAGRLRDAGFEVWLAGEQVVPGADAEAEARRGIRESRHALFLVTRRWLDRPGSRAEIDLVARRPAETHRRVAVLREPIDDRLVSDRLEGVHVVAWPADDPEPDARFWEVYCGLSRTPTGPRDRWSEQGRNLSTGPVEAGRGLDRSERVRCRSRPVLARSARGWTFLLADSGACFRVEGGGGGPPSIEPLPDLAGSSSVVTGPDGTLVVGLYDGALATLRDGEWDYRSADAPVLCLASTPRGVASGDAAGTVTLRADNLSPAGSASIGEPVVDLASFGGGLVALGARGGLWRLGWPEGEGRTMPSAPIPPRDGLGKLVGLVDAGDPASVSAFAQERIARVDPEARKVAVGLRRFPEGIGSVVGFGRGRGGKPPLGLLTDTGQVWIVEADLKTVAPIVSTAGPAGFVGIATGAGDGLLAWTASGTVVSIGRDRSARTLASVDAALAYPDPDHPGQVAVVHWHPDRGAMVARVRPELAG